MTYRLPDAISLSLINGWHVRRRSSPLVDPGGIGFTSDGLSVKPFVIGKRSVGQLRILSKLEAGSDSIEC